MVKDEGVFSLLSVSEVVKMLFFGFFWVVRRLSWEPIFSRVRV